MKSRLAALVVFLVSIVPPVTAEGPHNVLGDGNDLSLLFVVSGTAGSIEDGTLTLEGVPSVVYFSDRPDRVAGHMTVGSFTAEWTKGPDPFAVDPPNAVLSILRENGASDTVVELTSIESNGDTMRFGFEVLDGELSDGTLGPTSLFIDCFGLITPCRTN